MAAVSQLHDIKSRFEAELTRKSPLRVLKAENRLQANEILHRELGEIIEETHVSTSAMKHGYKYE